MIGRDIVTPAVAQRTAVLGVSAPDDHLGAGADSDVRDSGTRRAGYGDRAPRVGVRIVARALVQLVVVGKRRPAPDDHALSRPDSRRPIAARGRAFDRHRFPGIRGGIVTTADPLRRVPGQDLAPAPYHQ